MNNQEKIKIINGNRDIKRVLETSTKSARFCTLTYRAKGTGELAKHNLLLNCNFRKVYEKSLEKLKTLPTSGPISALAKGELIASIEASLKLGIGNNKNYTHKGKKENVGSDKNIRKWKDSDKIELLAFSRGKTIIEKGEYKKVNKRPKTIEKDKFRKQLTMSKVRTFRLDLENIKRVSNDKKTLIIC